MMPDTGMRSSKRKTENIIRSGLSGSSYGGSDESSSSGDGFLVLMVFLAILFIAGFIGLLVWLF